MALPDEAQRSSHGPQRTEHYAPMEYGLVYIIQRLLKSYLQTKKNHVNKIVLGIFVSFSYYLFCRREAISLRVE